MLVRTDLHGDSRAVMTDLLCDRHGLLLVASLIRFVKSAVRYAELSQELDSFAGEHLDW